MPGSPSWATRLAQPQGPLLQPPPMPVFSSSSLRGFPALPPALHTSELSGIPPIFSMLFRSPGAWPSQKALAQSPCWDPAPQKFIVCEPSTAGATPEFLTSCLMPFRTPSPGTQAFILITDQIPLPQSCGGPVPVRPACEIPLPLHGRLPPEASLAYPPGFCSTAPDLPGSGAVTPTYPSRGQALD